MIYDSEEDEFKWTKRFISLLVVAVEEVLGESIARERKSEQATAKVHELVELAKRLHRQKRDDKGKLYSIHAPEVECIAKGKAHKRYEFGCKVAVVSSSRRNWVIGIEAVHGTIRMTDIRWLVGSLAQVKRITGWQPGIAYCDRTYRGQGEEVKGTEILITGKRKKTVSRWEWQWFRRRAAIEPIIGHLKMENKLERNYLKGKEVDRVNAILAVCGFKFLHSLEG